MVPQFEPVNVVEEWAPFALGRVIIRGALVANATDSRIARAPYEHVPGSER